ncbi:MAG: hypothetical protein K6B68_08020 [Eubacterium sp.]|nr:hypothetical protein [Eubacterium sp.]
MSSGLSMTSVNKIKELAEAHEYSLAVEILDSQDLEKSFNPQFLRTCGEVYENVGRLKDARQLYVKAHSMAPEATRILFSLVNYYLKIGYYKLAERYFEEYVYYSSGSADELMNIKYIMKKARTDNIEELYDIINPYYRHNMDIDWSYELIILSKLLNKDELDIFAADYKATFKGSIYASNIDSIIKDEDVAKKYFYIYADGERQDDDPEQAEIRSFEKTILEKDYYRMNPEEAEAVITELVTEEPKEKKTPEGIEKGLKNFIKKTFKKKEDTSSDKDNPSKENDENESDKDSEEKIQAEVEKTDSDVNVSEADSKSSDTESGNEAESSKTDEQTDKSGDDSSVQEAEKAETSILYSEESEEDEEKEESEQSFVTFEFDDGFAPESDTIAGLGEVEFEFEDNDESENVFKEFAKYQDTVSFDEPEVLPEVEIEEEVPEPETYYKEEPVSYEPEVKEEPTPEVKEETSEPDSYYKEEQVSNEPEIKEEYEPEVKEETSEPDYSYEEEPVSYEPEVKEEPIPEVKEEYAPEVKEEIPETDSYSEEEKASYEPDYSYERESEEFVPEVEEDIPELEDEYSYDNSAFANYSDVDELNDSEESDTTESDEIEPEDSEVDELRNKFVEIRNSFFSSDYNDFKVREKAEEDELIGYDEPEPESLQHIDEDISSETEYEYQSTSDYRSEYEYQPADEYHSDLENYSEPVVQVENESEIEPEIESEIESESGFEPETEPIYEPESEPIYESKSEPESGAIFESEKNTEFSEEDDFLYKKEEDSIHKKEDTFSYMKEDIPSMDFRSFSSDLFPSLANNDNDVKVDNNFTEVVKTESEKLDEGLKEEEAKLMEAKALLESLGIKL